MSYTMNTIQYFENNIESSMSSKYINPLTFNFRCNLVLKR